MARKRDEYIRAKLKLIWEIDPGTRSAIVYSSPSSMTSVSPDGTVSGTDILPGFTLSLRDLVDRAERR